MSYSEIYDSLNFYLLDKMKENYKYKYYYFIESTKLIILKSD